MPKRKPAKGPTDTERIDWMSRIPFMLYRDVDPATGELIDHFTMVLEGEPTRRGIVNESLRAAIDAAMSAKEKR